MKNVLKYIGIGLFLAIMAVINFKSCVGELFVSNEELADMEYEKRNGEQSYWDGMYSCELECTNCPESTSAFGEDNKWDGRTFIEYDRIQYIALETGDTIWSNDIDDFELSKEKSYTFNSKDGIEFNIFIY